MTNASVNNMFKFIPVIVVSLALSVGAFAGTAHAEYNGGFEGIEVPDFGGYSPDTFSSYSPDTFSSYSPDTYGSYSPDTYGTYSPDTYGSYSPDTYGTYSPDTYSYSPFSGSSYGSSYGSSANYGSSIPSYAAQYIPSYAMQYIPSYAQPQRPMPMPTYTTSAPNTNTNTNTNTGVNTNTNTNTPTAVATATNGPITNTNTFAPVINVGSVGTHREADYNIPAPYCNIYVSSNNYNNYNSYNYNFPVTLSWNSSNATRGYISPNVGNVSAQGSTTVHPNGYTTYTLTVYGAGGSASCQTTTNYATGYVAPAPIYTAAPATPYVSLSQIPYTGFDFGPFGNAMYWAALLAVAGAAAYLLVYFIPGRRNFAFANFSGGRKNPIREASRSNGAGSAFASKDLESVFKSSLVPATSIPTVLDSEESHPAVASVLPKIEASRLTTDSMIVDRSSGAPRIVIARN